jgi:hypothetical protein
VLDGRLCAFAPRVAVGFKRFPYDCQNLIVRVRASGDDATIYRFAPSSSIGVRLSGLLRSETRTLAGWNITAINHQERLYTSKPVFDFNMGTTANPLYAVLICTPTRVPHTQPACRTWLCADRPLACNVPLEAHRAATVIYVRLAARTSPVPRACRRHAVGVPHTVAPHRLYDAITSTIRSPTHISNARAMTAEELKKYQTDKLIVPYYNDVSEAVFSISISREPHSFIFNFAVRPPTSL